MHDLSDDARSILDSARHAHDPTDGDRKRLKTAMVVKLEAAAASSTADLSAAWGAAAGTGAVTRGLFGAKVVATAVALSAAAAFAVWWSRPADAPSRVERTTATASSSPLAEDADVLAEARTYVREGHAARALALLDREAGRFAHGALREEFLAVRGLASRQLEQNKK